MAAGNQAEKGICALLVIAPKKGKPKIYKPNRKISTQNSTTP